MKQNKILPQKIFQYKEEILAFSLRYFAQVYLHIIENLDQGCTTLRADLIKCGPRLVGIVEKDSPFNGQIYEIFADS